MAETVPPAPGGGSIGKFSKVCALLRKIGPDLALRLLVGLLIELLRRAAEGRSWDDLL
ncbi:hypothetical protein GCM10027187_40200 [Streptosporangium sandarakinum]|uniref:Uncharacterized protein n=1 Tax=Streptosporangium sandarakinum TaxID=1260955 RepID=A0A852V854_9ACTN|nr:hypothetical protein [Streptosporangium sandarakinum]NYF44649.1 hypothetical protein [Streptosporangium sandarakinum]